MGQYLNTWGKKNDVSESSQGNHTYLIPRVNLVNFFHGCFWAKANIPKCLLMEQVQVNSTIYLKVLLGFALCCWGSVTSPGHRTGFSDAVDPVKLCKNQCELSICNSAKDVSGYYYFFKHVSMFVKMKQSFNMKSWLKLNEIAMYYPDFTSTSSSSIMN